MKLKTVLIVFLCFFNSNIKAQTEYAEGRFSFSITPISYLQKHGTTNNSNNLMINENSKFGSLGLLYAIKKSDKYKFQAGIKWQGINLLFSNTTPNSEFPATIENISQSVNGSPMGNLFSVPFQYVMTIPLTNFFDFNLNIGVNLHFVHQNSDTFYCATFNNVNEIEISNPYGNVAYIKSSTQNNFDFSTGLLIGFGIVTKLKKVNYQCNLIGNLNFWNMKKMNYHFENLETINQSGEFISKGNYLGLELVITPKKEKKE